MDLKHRKLGEQGGVHRGGVQSARQGSQPLQEHEQTGSGKPRLREGRSLVQDHTASERRSWDSNQDSVMTPLPLLCRLKAAGRSNFYKASPPTPLLKF